MSNSMMREAFYKGYDDVFFHTFNEPDHQLNYALYGVAPLSSEFYNKLRVATQQMWKIMEKTRDYILTLSNNELLELGYSPKIIPHLANTHMKHDTVVSRFDVIRTGDSFKFIEINNDTPFLILENFLMNKELTQSLGLDEEIHNKEQLFREGMLHAVTESVAYLDTDVSTANFYVMSYSKEQDLEDYLTAKFFYDNLASMVPSAKHISFDELFVDMDTNAAYDSEGNKIDVLFKPSYPYEFLIDDEYADGSGSIGLDLIQLYNNKHIALVTPPRTHILQNKSVFAAITNLHNAGGFFNSAESKVIEEHLAKTYFNADKFNDSKTDYVIKACIGREGQSVQIIKHNSDEIHSSKINKYDDEKPVYQELIKTPERKVVVDDNYTSLHEVIGVFVSGGRYAGSVIRLGGEITEWDSHWIAAYKAD